MRKVGKRTDATITELKRTPPFSPASHTEETGSTLPYRARLRLTLAGRRVAGCAGWGRAVSLRLHESKEAVETCRQLLVQPFLRRRSLT